MKQFLLFKTDYMSAEATVMDNGDVFTSVQTAPAVVVLPFWRDPESMELSVLLLKQTRPECDGALTIKTCGGYLAAEESRKQCALRNLDRKMGIVCITEDDLHEDGRTLGYSVVNVPITIFRVRLQGDCPPPRETTDSVEVLPIREAIRRARRGEFLDDSTTLPIYQLYIDECNGEFS